MRYELYTQASDYKKYAHLYILSSNNIESIFLFMESNPLPKKSKYVIIDNETPNPVNYFQLGLQEPPTAEKHYEIIYDCKLARAYYNHIKFENLDYDPYETDLEIPFEAIFDAAKFETDLYFEDYNSKV